MMMMMMMMMMVSMMMTFGLFHIFSLFHIFPLSHSVWLFHNVWLFHIFGDTRFFQKHLPVLLIFPLFHIFGLFHKLWLFHKVSDPGRYRVSCSRITIFGAAKTIVCWIRLGWKFGCNRFSTTFTIDFNLHKVVTTWLIIEKWWNMRWKGGGNFDRTENTLFFRVMRRA